MPVMCKCMSEARVREDAERKERERLEHIARLRATGLRDTALREYLSLIHILDVYKRQDSNSFKRIVALSKDEDMQKRWKYYLKNIKDDTFEFSAIIKEIQKFLEPVFNTIMNEDEWQRQWIAKNG